MRPTWKIHVTAVACLLAVPQLALADDVEAQLRQMQERMSELEQKLQATNDELETSKQKADQQEKLIEKAGLDESRGAASGIADFLNMVEVDGFIAASYNYNFNVLKDQDMAQPGVPGDFGPTTVAGENGGILGITAPGHSNDNTFQLDQLWFGIGKTATMESPAGFRADIVYGALADANREGTFFTNGPPDDESLGADDHGTGDLPHLFQAYAEYLVPVGESGISAKGGRFATPIGAESFRQDSNFNITRGITWSLQPVNHTGLLVSGKCGSCGIDWLLGVVNGYSDTMSDRDNEKGFLGGLKYSRETWAYATNIFYGGDSGDWAPWAFAGFGAGTPNGAGRSGDKLGVSDHVFSWNPTDQFSAFVNYDYYWTADSNSAASGNTGFTGTNVHAIALASRYAITEATGVSLRGEYQTWDIAAPGNNPELDFWALTLTGDHTLTENLIVKAEVRYDVGKISGAPDNFFLDGGDGPTAFDDNDQVLGLVQMMYKF
jgi:hypothetical protein